MSGAAGYDIYRSPVGGGPYTNVANGWASTNYVDSGLADGTTNYYVVRAIQGTCQGTNSVEVSATTAAPMTPFQQWQVRYFGSTTNSLGAAGADPFGKGISNGNQFLAGLNPTNPASMFQIIAVSTAGGTNTVTWKASGGDITAVSFGGPTIITNIVQGSVGLPDGSYSNSFRDISGPMIIVPSGDTVTNYSDTSGTNQFYRIRLGP